MNVRGLDRALQALAAYLLELVVCGAWAWFLYRRCLAPGRPLLSLFTRDVDCVGRENMPMAGRSLREALEDHQFKWLPHGDDQPPAARFVWPDPDRSEVEIEFLAPARGDGRQRTVELQDRIVAQTLRDLEILLEHPLAITIDGASPLAGELAYRGTVRVPAMAHFMIQKALIHARRTEEQRVKDFAYVLDILDNNNGLADAALDGMVATSARRPRDVATFQAVLTDRIGDARFMRLIVEQFPQEGGATPRYLGTEAEEWLARLQAAL